jgi:hypothetical protein
MEVVILFTFLEIFMFREHARLSDTDGTANEEKCSFLKSRVVNQN